jgi:hypothetical protein
MVTKANNSRDITYPETTTNGLTVICSQETQETHSDLND